MNLNTDNSKRVSEDEEFQKNILTSVGLPKALSLASKSNKIGELNHAIKIYIDILTKFPKNKKASTGLADIQRSSLFIFTQHPPENALKSVVELYRSQQLEKALVNCSTLVEQYPGSDVVLNIQGVILNSSKQSNRAVRAYTRALIINPENAEVYNNMGNTLMGQGKFEEAVSAFSKAVAIQPDYADAWYNLGNVHNEQDKLEQAIGAYDEALAINPQQAEIYVNKAIALQKQGKIDVALNSFTSAINLKPELAEAHNGMGNILIQFGKYDDAIRALDKAIDNRPNYAAAYNNKGNALSQKGDIHAAINAYETASQLDPSLADATHNLGLALLKIGNLQDGLERYEARWRLAEFSVQKRNFSKPMWDGLEDITDKSVLVWCEQGIGDTLNWCSILAHLERRAKRCILECPDKLVPLIRRSFPNITVISKNMESTSESFDLHTPMGSLYRCLLSDINEQNNHEAFLIPDTSRVEYWKERLKLTGPGPYVGVSWKSANMSVSRQKNHALLTEWRPIFEMRGVTFINLQYKDFDHDITATEQLYQTKIHNFDDLNHFENVDDVAALCAALDAVVSTKITVPFISAGVGTLTMLANWKHSPWNNVLLNPHGPSVKVYEREASVAWEAVFQAISNDLVNLIDMQTI